MSYDFLPEGTKASPTKPLYKEKRKKAPGKKERGGPPVAACGNLKWPALPGEGVGGKETKVDNFLTCAWSAIKEDHVSSSNRPEGGV